MRLGVFTFVNDTAIGPVDVAVALETRGFASLFVTEHSHIPVNTKLRTRWAVRSRRSTTGRSIHSSR